MTICNEVTAWDRGGYCTAITRTGTTTQNYLGRVMDTGFQLRGAAQLPRNP